MDLTTALGRTTRYAVATLPEGATELTETSPAGLDTVTLTRGDESRTVSLADGTIVALELAPDPRFKMQAPAWKQLDVYTPASGSQPALHAVLSEVQTASPTDPTQPLASSTDALTVNGRTFERAYDGGSARTITDTTPLGRVRTLTLDAAGRVTVSQVQGLYAVTFGYDALGRLTTVSQGPTTPGPETRTFTLGYDALNRLVSLTDPLSRVVELLDFDGADRARTERLPGPAGPRDVLLTYDANGNLTSLAPPGRPAHGFQHTKVNLESLYDPPQVAPPLATKATAYTYNLDRQLELVTRPSAASPSTDEVDLSYEVAAGRLETVLLTERDEAIELAYSPGTGRLERASGPAPAAAANPPKLRYSHAGILPIGTTWTCTTPPCPAGTVEGDVERTYDASFRVTSQRVNGAQEATFTYDDDDLLTAIAAGGTTLAIARDPQKGGLVTGSSIAGSIAESRTQNGFGELSSQTFTLGAATLYAVTYDDGSDHRRDGLGRITRKTETIARPGGGSDTLVWDYTYDAAGRLETVTRDGVLVSSYEYDPNGNRLARRGVGGTLIAEGTYDDQDRLLTYGLPPSPVTQSYTPNGELAAKTDASGMTTYEYDPLGNLRRVVLSGGSAIDYVVDAEGRRTGKTVGGALTQAFLHDGQLRVVAELDRGNQIVSRFVYGTQVNVAELMIKSGVTYRIVTDQLGSVRLVVNTADGSIAQRIDFDEFGVIAQDTNPGFQPFGFAGGLYDATTGLVRFGMRDFDGGTGRWIAMDPLRFRAGSGNLYSYAGGDPINWYDPHGLTTGRTPPPPPGYDPRAWKFGRYDDGTPFLKDPQGNTYRPHPEDQYHWPHWDKSLPDGKSGGRIPPDSFKPGARNPNQSPEDPNGGAPEWQPPDLPMVPVLPLEPWLPLLPGVCPVPGLAPAL